MGKYNFTAARVAQNAKLLLESNRSSQHPPWLKPMNTIPPPQILVRTQPVQHRRIKQHLKRGKPSKQFMPQQLEYVEDRLREEFFTDHPWELARPRLLLENDGKDHQRNDWRKSSQPGRSLDGESVVQRQMLLMAEGLPRTRAFDQARKEFYKSRHDAEIAARVQREEALATGAYFGMSQLEIGMNLENDTFNIFRAWAKQEVVVAEQARNAAYTGESTDGSQEADEDLTSLESAVDIIGSNTERSRSQGQRAPNS